jgi:DNA-binding CsgD family transcriptional regulator
MARPTESLSTRCHCYPVWHSVGETDGCIFTIRKRLCSKTIQVLQYLSYGWTYAKIGEYIYISPSMCKYYERKAETVLKTKNRTESVAVALRLGIIY